jgi:hypothetical protein
MLAFLKREKARPALRRRLTQVEVADDQESEQTGSGKRGDPLLWPPSHFLEWIAGLQQDVSHQVSKTHMRPVPQQLLELGVYCFSG